MALKDEFIQLTLTNSAKNNIYSLRDTIDSSEEAMLSLGNKSKPMIAVRDQYSNSLTGTGEADKIRSFTNYGFSNDTLNWALWLALYNDSWVFRRAIDKPAQDEVNCGFTLLGKEDYSIVYKVFNKYKSDMTQLLMWGALFGGSIAVIMFEGIEDSEMEKPLSKARIKGKKFKLYVTDRWYGVGVDSEDTVTNMKDVDFGKPKMYTITFPDGQSYRVHHSYVLRYEHRVAPRLVKNGQLQGWGYAEGAHILNELSRDDQLKAAAQSLVNKSLIEVIKMAGMRGIFMGTDKCNEEQLRKRLEMVNWGRNYNSLTFLDKDDEYTQNTFSGLNGLSDMLQQNMWLISAALEMQGILYGDLRGGFSQAEDDMKRYAVTIKNRCDTYYRPVLNKFLKIIFIVCDIKGNVDFNFNSINQKEENVEKVEAIKNYTEMLNSLYEKQIIGKYQMAKAIQDFIEKDVILIPFSNAQMERLKFEEQNDILSAYKKMGKEQPNSSELGFDSEFGNDDEDLGFENEFNGDIENSSSNLDLDNNAELGE